MNDVATDYKMSFEHRLKGKITETIVKELLVDDGIE